MDLPPINRPPHIGNIDMQGARYLRAVVKANLLESNRGIYSVCCSHEFVLEAAVDQAIADGGYLLVEATANQVNQFGGYTGMRPRDFRQHVLAIAGRRGLPEERIILGGDHLGPVCWTSDEAEIAMSKAEELVRSFAEAGFSKIHLDCSMVLKGDPEVLDDATVAARAARLCAAVEDTVQTALRNRDIVYVIGTEVPPPGGADEELGAIVPTPAERASHTLDVHKQVFFRHGLHDAWKRVIALVVQPGVEFDNSHVVDYAAERAKHLTILADHNTDGIAFEAHSTDYQRPQAFIELVRDHFAILKVGPALTFAMREALFALSDVEKVLIPSGAQARLPEKCEAIMRENPVFWERFYLGSEHQKAILRQYSLSDRIRYYWPDPIIEAAISCLFRNLESCDIPLGVISRYFPDLFDQVRAGTLVPEPKSLVKAHIRHALAPYAAACRGTCN